MGFFASVMLAVLCGLLCILALVFTIISISKSKTQNAVIWGVSFLLVLTGCLYFVIHSAHLFRLKFEDTFVNSFQNGGYANSKLSEAEDRIKKEQRQEFIDTLQNNVSEMYETIIPVEFYINKPAEKDVNDNLIVPFIYPYRMRFDETNMTGDIILKTEDTALVRNLSEVVFDHNFVLGKTKNSHSQDLMMKGVPDSEYIIFDMRSGEYVTAPNERFLWETAKKLGYTGAESLTPLSTSYQGWLSELNFQF